MVNKHYIKRAFQRMVIRSKRHASQNNPTLKQDNENEVLQSCRNLIHSVDSELLVCPDSGRKFIVNNKVHINIIILDNKIIVSNNEYYREVLISDYGIKSINQVFNGHLKKTVNLVDYSIKINAKHTLNNVTILTTYL